MNNRPLKDINLSSTLPIEDDIESSIKSLKGSKPQKKPETIAEHQATILWCLQFLALLNILVEQETANANEVWEVVVATKEAVAVTSNYQSNPIHHNNIEHYKVVADSYRTLIEVHREHITQLRHMNTIKLTRNSIASAAMFTIFAALISNTSLTVDSVTDGYILLWDVGVNIFSQYS